MKKVLFIAVAALAFAACGNSSANEEQTLEATPATEVVETPAVDTTAAPAVDSTAVTATEVK
ncbi:MAG: hypothetical protein RSC28_08700 [Bacteroidales bacterium]